MNNNKKLTEKNDKGTKLSKKLCPKFNDDLKKKFEQIKKSKKDNISSKNKTQKKMIWYKITLATYDRKITTKSVIDSVDN